MAQLSTKPYLVASLNVMVAARQNSSPDRTFSDEEIVEILLAMAENEAIAARSRASHQQQWPGRVNEFGS